MTDTLRLSEGARDGLVHELAQLWEVVHGHGPGCLTGFHGMTDQQLARTVQEYRGRARDLQDQERE